MYRGDAPCGSCTSSCGGTAGVVPPRRSRPPRRSVHTSSCDQLSGGLLHRRQWQSGKSYLSIHVGSGTAAASTCTSASNGQRQASECYRG